jgi:hypothetical protein
MTRGFSHKRKRGEALLFDGADGGNGNLRRLCVRETLGANEQQNFFLVVTQNAKGFLRVNRARAALTKSLGLVAGEHFNSNVHRPCPCRASGREWLMPRLFAERND